MVPAFFADTDRTKRTWEAMLAVAPHMIPMFTQPTPNLAGGVNINFDINAWGRMVAKVAETLVQVHQDTIAKANGVPTP